MVGVVQIPRGAARSRADFLSAESKSQSHDRQLLPTYVSVGYVDAVGTGKAGRVYLGQYD
ncbi:hypothetical protein SAMN02799641_05901 [Rhodococcus erythropolis]|nr:hypothetical protein SAMN02799641_05901 [Rhodococcus erythropolis]